MAATAARHAWEHLFLRRCVILVPRKGHFNTESTVGVDGSSPTAGRRACCGSRATLDWSRQVRVHASPSEVDLFQRMLVSGTFKVYFLGECRDVSRESTAIKMSCQQILRCNQRPAFFLFFFSLLKPTSSPNRMVVKNFSPKNCL